MFISAAAKVGRHFVSALAALANGPKAANTKYKKETNQKIFICDGKVTFYNQVNYQKITRFAQI